MATTMTETAPTAATNNTGIRLTEDGRRIWVEGNTYPAKDAIKGAGGHWDADRKCWWIGAGNRAALEAALATVRPTTPGTCAKCGASVDPRYTLCLRCKPAPSRCRQCGAKPGPRGWPRIYKSGICSDCYQGDREEREMGY